MPRLAGTVADSLLALQRACLPSTAWLPRFLQAKRLIDTSAGHTLDASCGNGDFTVWMAQQGMRITGVDFSAHELELAQARARDTGVSIDFEVCDLANAHGLPDAGFDQILSLDTIVHIPDDGAVFDTFARVLKPGGRLVASLAGTALRGEEACTRCRDSCAVLSRRRWTARLLTTAFPGYGLHLLTCRKQCPNTVTTKSIRF